MSARAEVSRPTEKAADLTDRPTPPAIRIADLLIVARATGDRYGEVLFDHMLDRALGGAR